MREALCPIFLTSHLNSGFSSIWKALIFQTLPMDFFPSHTAYLSSLAWSLWCPRGRMAFPPTYPPLTTPSPASLCSSPCCFSPEAWWPLASPGRDFSNPTWLISSLPSSLCSKVPLSEVLPCTPDGGQLVSFLILILNPQNVSWHILGPTTLHKRRTHTYTK